MTKYYVDGNGAYLGGFDGAQPPDGAIEVPEAPTDARQVWDGVAWGAIPATVPGTVTARQGRLQLHADGKLAAVEGMMSAPEADPALKIEWEYATVWERESPWIGQLAAALELTDADLDRMFTEGAAR